MICLNFTKYVNDNAEELRKLFVNHVGKKKLVVVEEIGHDEHDWDDFFAKMFQQIKLNVNGNISDILRADFSTTGKVESILSYACVMDSFKAYFQYDRCIPLCGIRNVKLLGTLDDWVKLKQKALDLMTFMKQTKFEDYIANILPILDEFVNTYNGNPNQDYWNKIMNIKSGHIGSGSYKLISGWILNFYIGCANKTMDPKDIY